MVDKASSDSGIKAKLYGLFGRNRSRDSASSTFEGFIDVMSLQNSQHKQYRLFTLDFYLIILNDISTGKCKNDPCQYIRTVFTICASVFNCPLIYDDGEHYWAVEGVKKVIKLIYNLVVYFAYYELC